MAGKQVRINLVKKGQIVKSIWRKRTPIVAQGRRGK